MPNPPLPGSPEVATSPDVEAAAILVDELHKMGIVLYEEGTEISVSPMRLAPALERIIAASVGAQSARVAALREALRPTRESWMIGDAPRFGFQCPVCRHRWDADDPPSHEDTCIAAALLGSP